MVFNDEIIKYSKLQRTGIKDMADYEESLSRDYESVVKFLPMHCLDILDIGAGMGGMDILLYKHYNKKVKLHLVDKDGVSENLHYDYKDEASFYNQLKIARELLSMNGVDPMDIITYDVNKGKFPARPEQGFQIIISLISCGFHYPVTTYMERMKCLSSGIIVLDVRKGTGQIDTLRDNFKTVDIIKEYRKYERVLIS